MSGEVKTPKRSYSSPLRDRQAEETRRRILESARQLFLAHGYAGTTVAAVAEKAAVSPETVYLSIGSKRGLLEGVMDMTGPHNSMAEDHEWWEKVALVVDPGERLDMMAQYSCRILARTSPIHAIIRGAADKEAFAAELRRSLLDERLGNQTKRIGDYLAGSLRAGLTTSAAGEVFCALTSPELYHLLTIDLGWSADQHRVWLARALRNELLGENGE